MKYIKIKNSPESNKHQIKNGVLHDVSNIFKWECRYSNTEEADKHRRWARLCFSKGKLIAWISRIDHIDYGRIYTIKDFFPSNGNSNPQYSGKETSFEKSKQGVEKRFLEFLSSYC